jgi:DNA-binding CsgD family transcriptional regulator
MLPMELPPSEIVERDSEGIPVFTGDSYYRNHPREYEITLAMAAEGNSIRSIARVIGASKNTVQAILKREYGSMTMDRYREAVGVRLRSSLAQMLDLIDEDMQDEDRMKETSLRDKAYTLKELAEKVQLFSGGATHRSEDREEQNHADDLARLRRVHSAIDAEATEKTEQGISLTEDTEKNT